MESDHPTGWRASHCPSSSFQRHQERRRHRHRRRGVVAGATAGGSRRRDCRHRSFSGHASPGPREAPERSGTHGCAEAGPAIQPLRGSGRRLRSLSSATPGTVPGGGEPGAETGRRGRHGDVGPENMPPANAIWDDELQAAGAQIFKLPAVDNHACCDNTQKMTALLEKAGFVSINVWSESIEHRWRPDDHFEYQVGSTSRLRLQSLEVMDREACLRRVRARLSGGDGEQYVYRGEVFMATAVKADPPAGNH